MICMIINAFHVHGLLHETLCHIGITTAEKERESKREQESFVAINTLCKQGNCNQR